MTDEERVAILIRAAEGGAFDRIYDEWFAAMPGVGDLGDEERLEDEALALASDVLGAPPSRAVLEGAALRHQFVSIALMARLRSRKDVEKVLARRKVIG